MTQAFYTAISGMTAGQTKVSVVADNIANLNTVGFKASKVNFSDIYYRTSSAGQAPTGGVGGTNPRQIGIGAQTASIARDFSAGTTLTTGLNTDLCINGNSYFTVASPTVEILYTRDGNFKIDADGHMVTSSGYKVLGTSKMLDTKTSTIPIKIPTYVTTTTTPTKAETLNSKLLNNLNAIKAGGIKGGDFDIITHNGDKLKVTITGNEDLSELKDKINAAIDAAAADGKFSEAAADPAN
ncbi:MAG: flagellar hook-basal body complex protein, partial [Clostridia bacterium]|nr:flagellar hook-basal body complex protein [Clostridia bacterium]